MSETNSANKTILVVEDDLAFRQRIVEALQHNAFSTIPTSNGEEAWEAIKTHPAVVVILDIVMPSTDGLWFLEQLRADMQYKDLPVIVLTNLDHGEKIGKVITKGVARLLVKSDESLNELPLVVKEVVTEYSLN